ncbi:MAG: hypothetical protein HOP28_00140, partial [Gemmatimonadales bacterium]|nr:hypothetical protein [Gemmatimonadales bacterium]
DHESAAPTTASSFRSTQPGLTRLVLSDIHLDARALVCLAVLAIGSGIAVAVGPAFAAARASAADAMRRGTVVTPVFAGLRRLTGRGALVIAEIALAVMLMVASVLTIKSLGRLLATDAGYDPDNVLTVRIALSPRRTPGDSAARVWRDVLDRVRALPGVSSAAIGTCSPLGDHCEGTDISLAGRNGTFHVSYHVVGPEYFKTLRTPLVQGRDFSDQDRAGAPQVLIVNQTAARTIWGGADPLRTPVGSGDEATQVVGVVGDARYEDLEAAPAPAIFAPFTQSSRSRAMLFVRATGDPSSLAASVRSAIRAADRNHAVSDIRTLRQRVHEVTARSRFSTQVLGLFAALAVTLAAIGIYGVLALAVAQRTRELGVRLAVGADRSTLLMMVLRQALGLAAAGALAGFAGVFAASKLLGTVLYGVRAVDLPAFAASAAVLALAVVGAASVPALRATRISPLEALRSE